MRKLLSRRPSAAMIVAIIAVILAVGGTATAALNKKDKKKVRNIADQEISKQAPGLSVANAANAANAAKASNSDALGGVGPAGYTQGGGHSYFGTKSAGTSTNNNALLNIPGFANLTFNCAANGVDSTVHITNTSGVSLGDVGQNQTISQANLEPFGPAISPGGTVNIVHTNGGTGAVANTTLQLWNASASKTATVEISNVFCDYTASALTNQ
jgi:hypothetical protein